MSQLRSLLYVSRILIPLAERPAEIDRIVTVSAERNRTLNVTGALIVTKSRFAQVLEGPDPAIEGLMASIRRDPRHGELAVVFDRAIAGRRFDGWSMAYSGHAEYVTRLVDPLGGVSTPPGDADALRLIGFMKGMAGS